MKIVKTASGKMPTCYLLNTPDFFYYMVVYTCKYIL